jgi:hypothetical protein
VDTGCLVAFTQGIKYDIEKAGNLKSMFFGGYKSNLLTSTEKDGFAAALIYPFFMQLRGDLSQCKVGLCYLTVERISQIRKSATYNSAS